MHSRSMISRHKALKMTQEKNLEKFGTIWGVYYTTGIDIRTML